MGTAKLLESCALRSRIRTIDSSPVGLVSINAFLFTDSLSLAWLFEPVQAVVATPSNSWIQQCFPCRSELSGCTRSIPSQGCAPADQTWGAL